MATQMQFKVYLEGNHMAAWTFRKKKQQQSRVFLALFFMFTLMWITENELKQVIENKGDEQLTLIEIQSGGEKMRNASSQQGVASKVKMSSDEK